MADERLERAIRLVQSGKMDDARKLLELILKEDRNNIPAWHWYAQTWSRDKDKIRVWEACLRFNPANPLAQEALRDLNFTQPKQTSSETKIPVRTAKTGIGPSQWLLWVSISLLAVAAIFAWTLVKNSTPIDPQQYKHVQPVEYYLYVPKAYSADQEWPLFVGIHGAGGNGLQCWQLWQSYADKEGFILLCPSIPGFPDGFYQDVGETTVWAAVGEVKKEYRVRQRMFFSGFSAGAYFIQGFTYHYAQYVSGLSILSAGLYQDPNMFPELIPMLVVIGDQDYASSVQSSQIFVSGLQQFGFDVQYKVMPGVGHAVTKDGVNLTIDLFRKTIGK
jgi:phospholipase/carboxylesterase